MNGDEFMEDNPKRSNNEERKLFRRIYMDTYDKVPQPEGKFKNLFQVMQEQNGVGNQPTDKKNKSSQ